MLRVRQRFGKYRIDRRLGDGGFAMVYRAHDTIAGIPVALKVPHPNRVSKNLLNDFRKEVRLTATLDHPNILPVKDAGFIDEKFYIAYPLGEGSLDDRLKRRLSFRLALSYSLQMLEAVAFAHRRRIMHCDIKPDNFILFPNDRLRLADFGIAKVAMRTLEASGSGTVGYVAPEQAMGKPSFRSDVFSLGLVMYRMFAGRRPEWPYTWPPPGIDRLRRNLHPDMIEFLHKALEVEHRKRFADATQMLAVFKRLRPRALKSAQAQRRRKTALRGDWRTIRRRQFLKQYGRLLGTRAACPRCHGPVSEFMKACCWCGHARPDAAQETRFPARCPRCRRGVKKDWRFCAWCYGPVIHAASTGRRYSDARYVARCANRACKGKLLMPFMRYCPWCRRRVARPWKIAGTKDQCPSCRWGVVRDFWDFCPWCARALPPK